jgi:hypothetical protein
VFGSHPPEEQELFLQDEKSLPKMRVRNDLAQLFISFASSPGHDITPLRSA